MWSVPPAEPPHQENAPGSAFQASTRSCIVMNGEETGTATTT